MQDEVHEPFPFDCQRAADLLDIMSSPVRLEVLQRVTVREWDVTSLATDLAVSQSALSQHLSKLRQAMLVTTRRSAQQVFYSSDSPAVREILGSLDRLGPMPVGRLTEAQEAARKQRTGRRRSGADS